MKKNNRLIAFIMVLIIILVAGSVMAFASGNAIAGSKEAQGATNLVNDAMSWAIVIGPTICILAIIYFFIRKGMADEMEQKKWKDRIVVAFVCAVGIVIASGAVKIIISYFQ